MVARAARLHRAARPAPVPDEGGPLSGDPHWERAGALGGAALGAFADAAGTEPLEPELAWAEAVALVRERSDLTRWEPQGPVTAGGAGRLLPGADGWLAVSLPRPDDLELLPAWLGLDPPVADDDRVPWAAVAAALAGRQVDQAAASAQELGLAVAVVADAGRLRTGDEQLVARGTLDPTSGHVAHRVAPPAAPPTGGRPLDGLVVVDLSSLWAGPMCARMLGRAGAHVVKVESTTRPDGARSGNRELFERLHAGHEQRSIPFEAPEGRDELRRILGSADVVIEGSRPRAMERLGIDPGTVVAARPGAVWLSITAYGRTGPWRDRVGFGDDCAAAGGLVQWTADASPAFVGDAVADPLTGMVAAALVARAVARGGGVLLDVALREVARAAALEVVPSW